MPSKGKELADQLIAYAISQKDYALLNYLRQQIDKILIDTTAVVKSATKLSEENEKEIEASIRHRFSETTDVIFKTEVSLIGGIEVVFKDYRYDGSVRGMLEQLKGVAN